MKSLNKIAKIAGYATLGVIIGFIAAIMLLVATQTAEAQRSDAVWAERVGSYIESIWFEGRDVLINGVNKYLNFGYTSGSSGYGFRDNGGDIEYKDDGGSWTAFNSFAGGHDAVSLAGTLDYLTISGQEITLGSITPDDVLATGQTDEYVLTYEATGDTWEWAAASAASFSDIDTDYGAETVSSVWTITGNWVNTTNPWADNEVADVLTIGAGSTIADNLIVEPDLSADVAAVDGDYLQYDSTGTNFTWRSASEVKSDLSLNLVENTALSTWNGTTNINTIGSISVGVWQGTPLTDSYVSDTLTIGSSGSVADAALSANVSLLGATIGVAELASADFGDFTCNGTTCSLDATYLTSADDTVSGSELDGVFSTTGLLRRTGANTYSTITDSSSNWDTAYGWGNHASAGYLTASPFGASVGPTELQSTDFGDFTCNGTTCSLDAVYLTTVDISANTNLVAGTGLTLSGDTINLDNDFGSSIDTGEITDDTITHADIADSDQTVTMCIYIEDPTADDDLQSIWANKTANDFLLTELWAESDQTVNFDLQVDDGTPADVNGTDLAPAAGEAEDTSLSGDTTVAAGEELDLAVTSVSGTPTWVSICWTGNWVD